MSNEKMPEGKRSLRRSVRGNLNGYIGATFWINFGASYDPHAEAKASAWLIEGNEAVEREIARDPRIKSKEANAIRSLLRGRH